MQRSNFPKSGPQVDWALDTAESTRHDGPLAVARRVIATARRNRTLLALWVGICVALAVVWAESVPPSYTASTRVLLTAFRPANGMASDVVLTLDAFRVESDLQVVSSERLLRFVFDRLDIAAEEPPKSRSLPGTLVAFGREFVRTALSLPPPPPPSSEEARRLAFDNFLSRVGVRRVGLSYVMEISYTSADPVRAERVANAIAAAYIWQTVQPKADAAQAGAALTSGQIATLTAQVAAAADAVSRGALINAPMPDADGHVIGAAMKPTRPSAPRKKLIVMLGGIIGALTGFIAIALSAVLYQRVYTSEDVEAATGLSTLAKVPSVRRGRRYRRRNDADAIAAFQTDTAFAAAIRDLRTAIRISTRNEEHPVVAFVGINPGAGATFITNVVSHTFTVGTHTTIVDVDLQRGGDPSTSKSTTSELALADILVFGASALEASEQGPGDVHRIAGASRDPGANAIADLTGSTMVRVIGELRGLGPVFLDLPALNTSADALAAALHADLVILVVTPGDLMAETFTASVAQLSRAGAHVSGVVLNKA